ncbi:MAG: carbohydrate ABC transporter permease [Phycisphaerales bacterium JB050]
MIGSGRKRLLIALAFLLPNLIGFLLFTAGPVLFSLYMSLTDWQLTKHNQYSEEKIRFIGLENYARLLWGDESHLFWDYFYNTVFLMIAIPISIAGSLLLAVWINSKATPQKPKSKVKWGMIGLGCTLAACLGAWVLAAPSAPTDVMSTQSGMTDLTEYQVQAMQRNGLVLFIGVVGAVITAGLFIGQMFFRAAFYLPTLLAGVAMFLLWKTLYRPRGGLINSVLDPILGVIERVVVHTPAVLWYGLGILFLAGSLWLLGRSFWIGVQRYRQRETGGFALFGRMAVLGALGAAAIGISFVLVQLPEQSLLASGYEDFDRATIVEIGQELKAIEGVDPAEVDLVVNALGDGASREDTLNALLSDPVLGQNRDAVRDAVKEQSVRVRRGFTAGHETDRGGLQPPDWLLSSRWAKPALVIMGIWLAIGGGNMLLYLAGLSNIPQSLYEAAAIDGATGWQRFINVTWPQLAPTTFFIVIMSTIGGLQGGFEQALVMTEGKADTIVLTYYLYNLAFTDDFQLGLASAVAWVMFAMIFAMTAFNFRFGSRLTNE